MLPVIHSNLKQLFDKGKSIFFYILENVCQCGRIDNKLNLYDASQA